ncbi:synapse differentiation-inducing gene protein 1-like [Rana temporaria]|uniref:synapse differentiation-inducing gene protein 1-like n=1 Tax=Rana temporaria TaxID=8407 RepID=UPI001AADE257|nr:synapse differentiation-inducing gene protein 1-like [Rana temporaria]
MYPPLNYSQDPNVPPAPYYAAPPPTVVTTQPTVIVVPQPAYKDYLGLSIMNMICCCLPIGIAALIFSVQTRDAANRQDAISAQANSRTAFTLNMVALGIGICCHIVWIAYVIYISVVLSAAASSYYG